MRLLNRIEELEKELLELKEQVKEEQEFPQEGDEYWYIHTSGAIYNEDWEDLGVEITMLEIGNVFKTEQDAHFAVEKLKVEAELRKYSKPFECGEINQYIFLDTDRDCIDVENRYHFPTQGTIYFESEEKVQEAVYAVGKERIKKYIFGVEE